MRIRARTSLLIAATTAGLVAILYSLSLVIVLGRFAELEKRDMRRALEQARGALQNELRELGTFNHDWAAWDDTCEFVAGRYPEYLDANLMDETFTGARLSLMIFVDHAGKIVFAKAMEWRRGERQAMPPELLERVRPGSPLLRTAEDGEEANGLFLAKPWPLLLSSQPILTSTMQGPPRGTLIMGRVLDPAELQGLEEITRLALEVKRLDRELPAEYQKALPELEQGPFVHPLSPSRAAAYGLLLDFDGKPAAVLRVDAPRETYRQGLVAVRYLVFSLLAVGVVYWIVVTALLQRSVLRRLSALSGSVAAVGRRRDLSARVQVPGRDELADLGGSINAMLTELEKAEETHRALTSAVPDLILRVREDGSVVDANRHSYPLLDRRASAGGALTLDQALPAELAARSLEEVRATLASNRLRMFEYRHPEGAGAGDYEVRTVAIGGEVLQIIRDITERKQADEVRKKELLLREIHHRVKNNLQVISSLLYLQSQQAGDPRLVRILEENRSRIRAIALIHEKLYQSGSPGAVRFAPYLRDLANNLLIASGGGAAGVRLEQRVEEGLVLGLDAATLCGLITSELVSNALRHAFPGGRSGRIRVELERLPGGLCRLAVEDDGVGLPEGFRLETSGAMGLQLVRLFVQQLEGTLELSAPPGSPGTGFRLEFREAEEP